MPKITTKAIESIQQSLRNIKNKIKNLKKNQKEQILDADSYDLNDSIYEDVNLEEIINNIDESEGELNDLLQPVSHDNRSKNAEKSEGGSILASIMNDDNTNKFIDSLEKAHDKTKKTTHVLQPINPNNKAKNAEKSEGGSILDDIMNDDNTNKFMDSLEKEYNKTKLRKIFDNIIKILAPLKKIKSLMPYINKVEKTANEINGQNIHTKKVTDQRQEQKNNHGGSRKL